MSKAAPPQRRPALDQQRSVSPDSVATLPAVLASSEPCPEQCLPVHVLEVGPSAPISEEEWLHRKRNMASADLDEWDEAHAGTRCTLCNQLVHWGTWHPYYRKWRREQLLG